MSEKNGAISVLIVEMALRLGQATKTAPIYWMRLQLAVDAYDAEHSPVKAEIKRLKVLIAG